MNGVNPATFFILPMLGKHPDEFPRFRDCWAGRTSTDEEKEWIKEKILPMGNIKLIEYDYTTKVVNLLLLNREEYKVFTDGMVKHYITKEIENILKLFSIKEDFIISFS